MGCWFGHRRLFAAGLIARIPRLVAVQSAMIDPLVQAFTSGLDAVPAVEPKGATLAEGIATAQPVRGRQLLRALRQTKGLCLNVSEDEIVSSQAWLARRGIWVEPTSAAAIAALPALFKHAAAGDEIVVLLTGNGLKGAPTMPPDGANERNA